MVTVWLDICTKTTWLGLEKDCPLLASPVVGLWVFHMHLIQMLTGSLHHETEAGPLLSWLVRVLLLVEITPFCVTSALLHICLSSLHANFLPASMLSERTQSRPNNETCCCKECDLWHSEINNRTENKRLLFYHHTERIIMSLSSRVKWCSTSAPSLFSHPLHLTSSHLLLL